MQARPRTTASAPLWFAVMETFSLGSTYATMLCRQFGYDPDETRKRAR